MRFKMIVTMVLVTSLSVFARTSAAQRPTQNPPTEPPSAQSDQGQQQSSNPAAPGRRSRGPVRMGGGMMNPDMMQMMAPDSLGSGRLSSRLDGMRQRVSRLLAALDDTRVRTMLGLTDQQADSLRKIIVDAETFTIKTRADIEVDSIELRELLRTDKPDRSMVMSKGDEISKAAAQLIDQYLDAILAAKAILTPEQQKMIRTYMERSARSFPAPRARR
jgi:Heavy-metal resistance